MRGIERAGDAEPILDSKGGFAGKTVMDVLGRAVDNRGEGMFGLLAWLLNGLFE